MIGWFRCLLGDHVTTIIEGQDWRHVACKRCGHVLESSRLLRPERVIQQQRQAERDAPSRKVG